MRRANLQLTVHDNLFSVTPLPAQAASVCTSAWGCKKVASHRVLARAASAVALFCDEHTIDWTLHQGMSTTSKPAA